MKQRHFLHVDTNSQSWSKNFLVGMVKKMNVASLVMEL